MLLQSQALHMCTMPSLVCNSVNSWVPQRHTVTSSILPHREYVCSSHATNPELVFTVAEKSYMHVHMALLVLVCLGCIAAMVRCHCRILTNCTFMLMSC